MSEETCLERLHRLHLAEVRFERTPLHEALDHLQTQGWRLDDGEASGGRPCGVHIFLALDDDDPLRAHPLTLSMAGVSLHEALIQVVQATAAAAGLRMVINERGVCLHRTVEPTAPAIPPPPPPSPNDCGSPLLHQDPVARALEAADGFLDLGLPREALVETEGVEPADVASKRRLLTVRGLAHQRLKQWTPMAAVSRGLIALEPDELTWLRWLALALARLGENAAARDVLVEAARRDPQGVDVSYALACLYVRLDDLTRAREQMRRTLALSPGHRARALADAEFQPLWEELAQQG